MEVTRWRLLLGLERGSLLIRVCWKNDRIRCTIRWLPVWTGVYIVSSISTVDVKTGSCLTLMFIARGVAKHGHTYLARNRILLLLRVIVLRRTSSKGYKNEASMSN